MKKRLVISGAVAIALILLVPPLLLAWIYGEAEPCRALAVERARLAADKGMGPAAMLEPWQKLATSQMSAAQCIGGLMDNWGERLSHHVAK